MKIDFDPWIDDGRANRADGDPIDRDLLAANLKAKFGYERDLQGNPMNTVPMPNLSHLILTDNFQLLEDKLEKAIPTGMIIVHGTDTTLSSCPSTQQQ